VAGGTQIPISACHEAGRLLLRLEGACTVAICGGLKSYLAHLRKPDTTDIYFDLSESAGLDSTFIGFLVSMATRKADPSSPAVHLVAPSPTALDALRRMYVLSLFDVCPNSPQTSSTWTILSMEKPRADRTVDVVVEAHEKLIEADARNAPIFKPVVEGFRAEKGRKQTEKNARGPSSGATWTDSSGSSSIISFNYS
jgi:hypothetical protein